MQKIIVFVLLASLSSFAANFTPVKAVSCIGNGAGDLLADGYLTIIATDGNDKAIPFYAGGDKQATTAPITRAITTGTLASLVLANPLLTHPTNILYRFVVTDNVTKRVTNYAKIVLTPNDTVVSSVFTEFNFCKLDISTLGTPPGLIYSAAILAPTALTTNKVPKALNGVTLGDSKYGDDGTTPTYNNAQLALISNVAACYDNGSSTPLVSCHVVMGEFTSHSDPVVITFPVAGRFTSPSSYRIIVYDNPFSAFASNFGQLPQVNYSFKSANGFVIDWVQTGVTDHVISWIAIGN